VVGVSGGCRGVAVMVAEIRVSCEMEEMLMWQCLIGADKFARIMTTFGWPDLKGGDYHMATFG